MPTSIGRTQHIFASEKRNTCQSSILARWQYFTLLCLLVGCIGADSSAAQTCYNTGDPTYSTSTNEQITICHSTADEGLYYTSPQYVAGTQYGQTGFNVQPLRIAPNTYRTVVHTASPKLTDATNCPLSDLGEPGWPQNPPPAPPGFPTFQHWIPVTPGWEWCFNGDSIQEASYNATGPTDPTPYTMGSTPQFVLWGTETNPGAVNFYGGTTNQSVATLSSGLSANTSYSQLSVNPLPFNIPWNGRLTLSNGSNNVTVTVAPQTFVTTTSALTSGSEYSQISVTQTPNALSSGELLILANGQQFDYLVVQARLCALASQLTSGTSYSTLSVTALPYTLPAGTVVVIGQSSTNQSVTLSATASAGSTSISVNSFIANANYNIGTNVLSPSVPTGSTTIPVNTFISNYSYPAGAQVQTAGIPQGATTIPLTTTLTPQNSYPAASTLTLLNDQGGFGGSANIMVVAGRYYRPWNDPYYYAYFVGERKIDDNPSCPWVPTYQGACGWREILEEARTTDFVNWDVLTNHSWVPMANLDANNYPVPINDRNGNPIESSYATTAAKVGSLLGSVNQVYTAADGVHTFRYFYADHPNTGNWQSDLQVWNLYEREATTADNNAFDGTGNIVWSAPTLVGQVPGGLVRVAKAHGANRWALVYSAHNGSNPTTDVQVEYSADMTGLPYTQWLSPLSHLLSKLPPDGTDYLNVQVGRVYGNGYAYTDPNTGLSKGYGDLIAQPDFMTDRDGNLAAPDAETPGYARGGMLTWTDFPFIVDNTTGSDSLWLGIYGSKVYQADFDISNNVTGDLVVNGDFATQTFTGNAALDGWTLLDNSQSSLGGGTNYPPSVVNGPDYPNAVAALLGPALSSNSEAVGGSGIDQIVNIPAGSHQATLSFSYNPSCPAGGGDFQTIYAYNVDTGAVNWVILPSCDNSQSWKSTTANLSSFIGHPVMLIAETRKANTTNTAPVRMLLGCETACFSLAVQ